MTTDIDIYRTANLLIEQHGEDAPIHATMQAEEQFWMSVVGYEQTSSRPKSMSALPPKADILMAITDFRL